MDELSWKDLAAGYATVSEFDQVPIFEAMSQKKDATEEMKMDEEGKL